MRLRRSDTPLPAVSSACARRRRRSVEGDTLVATTRPLHVRLGRRRGKKGNDFLAVIDADPASASYGQARHDRRDRPADDDGAPHRVLDAGERDAVCERPRCRPHVRLRRARSGAPESSHVVHRHGRLHASALLSAAAQRERARHVSACAPRAERRDDGQERRPGGDRRQRQGDPLGQQRRSGVRRRAPDAVQPGRAARARSRRLDQLLDARRRHFQRRHLPGVAPLRFEAARDRLLRRRRRTTTATSVRKSLDSGPTDRSTCRPSAAGSSASPA